MQRMLLFSQIMMSRQAGVVIFGFLRNEKSEKRGEFQVFFWLMPKPDWIELPKILIENGMRRVRVRQQSESTQK